MTEKVLIVTGAGRGIGAEVARRAAAQGFRVAVNYAVNDEAANSVVDAITRAGGTAIAVRGDVGSEADVMRLFETVDHELGPLTALVNNAGVVDRKTRVDGMSAARLERMFRINVIGSFLCAREAVKRMSRLNGGSGGAIVNLSSVAAKHGAGGEYVDYAAAKGAIDVMTTGLAREVAGEGIRVNAVRPGIIDTEIHASGGQPDRVAQMSPILPFGRAGTVEEVAAAVLFLLSDESSYTSGALFDVSGAR